jgi:hypothetical protein
MLAQQLVSFVDPMNKVAVKTKEKGTMLALIIVNGHVI